MEGIQGKRIVYMYRLLSKQAEADAKRIAYTKENENSISVDAESTATKDGALRSPGVPEIELSTTSILAKNDAMISDIKKAMLKGETIEIWEINLDEPVSEGTGNKFKATYYQGLCTECTVSSPSDDWSELSLTFGINGTGVEGQATVNDDDLDEMYTFVDTPKVTQQQSNENSEQS